MSVSDVMKHQQAAVEFWQQRKHRESANEYWNCFRSFPCSSPDHEMRYQIFHGYTSILREEYFEATDEDFKKMKAVYEDKHEPRLFRIEAAFTLGFLHYVRSERHKSEDYYQGAIHLGKRKPTKKDEKWDKKQMVLKTSLDGGAEILPGDYSTMKELTQIVMKDIQNNLDQLNAATCNTQSLGPKLISDGTMKAPTKKTHFMPIGRGGSSLTRQEINNLIDVGGLHCDCCKRKVAKLLNCGRCKRTFYCSKECQTKQWRGGGHKHYCRKEGEFKEGDLVQLARLKNKPELNESIMRIIGSDATSEGKYRVRIEGGVDDDPVFSIKKENLNQLRPFDCKGEPGGGKLEDQIGNLRLN